MARGLSKLSHEVLAELAELRGLNRIVPRLIQEDRERRWAEIGKRPGDPEVEMIDIYETEAGPEEGWGHADYSTMVRGAAVVSAWELFRGLLSDTLRRRALAYDLSRHPVLQRLVLDEEARWDRRLETVLTRYKEWLDVDLKQQLKWRRVTHACELRNALVHNGGRYTAKYLACERPILPRPDDLLYSPYRDAVELLERGDRVPLDEASVDRVLLDLIEAAQAVAVSAEGHGA